MWLCAMLETSRRRHGKDIQLFVQQIVQFNSKVIIKGPNYWPLLGESTGDLSIPHIKNK